MKLKDAKIGLRYKLKNTNKILTVKDIVYSENGTCIRVKIKVDNIEVDVSGDADVEPIDQIIENYEILDTKDNIDENIIENFVEDFNIHNENVKDKDETIETTTDNKYKSKSDNIKVSIRKFVFNCLDMNLDKENIINLMMENYNIDNKDARSKFAVYSFQYKKQKNK